jgi:lysophospholipase L1-like esterase
VPLLALAACGKGNPDKDGDDIRTYAALGDSYTSGVGLVPVSDEVCSRSSLNYPSLVAKALGVDDFVDASCAGAASDDLFAAQKTPTGSNPPQLEQVPADADLVTIGLGLNDNGLSVNLLYPCLQVNGVVGPKCDLYLQQPNSVFDAAITAMAGAVKADLKDIREKAPDARIVLIGYPRLLPDDATCPDEVPVVAAAAVRIRYALKKANEAMEATARKAEVDYVDMYTPSEGHDACSEDRWVNGQNIEIGKALAYHPFAEYHEAVAAKLETLLAGK